MARTHGLDCAVQQGAGCELAGRRASSQDAFQPLLLPLRLLVESPSNMELLERAKQEIGAATAGLRAPRGAEPCYAMAALLACGGFAGFAARRSKPSLIAGVVLGSGFGASGYAIGASIDDPADAPAAGGWPAADHRHPSTLTPFVPCWLAQRPTRRHCLGGAASVR